MTASAVLEAPASAEPDERLASERKNRSPAMNAYGSEVEVIQVVRTRLELRGDGETDPYRRITQYWSLDGKLLAEVDLVAAVTQQRQHEGS